MHGMAPLSSPGGRERGLLSLLVQVARVSLQRVLSNGTPAVIRAAQLLCFSCNWPASPALRPLRSAAPQIAYQSKNPKWILPARYYNAGALPADLRQASCSLRVHVGSADACSRPRLHRAAHIPTCASVHAQHALTCCPCTCNTDVASTATSIRFHVAHTSCFVKKYRKSGNSYNTDE